MLPIIGNPLLAAAAALALGTVRIDGVRETATSWRIPPAVAVVRGARLFMDAGYRAPLEVKLAREIERANPRLGPVDALLLGTHAIDAARAAGIDPAFFAATLLQESAFDPDAFSAAGAVGIAQFEPSTAAEQGLADPWDPSEAIVAAARLLAGYVAAYRGRGGDPYALALAAYNAGPLAVARYGGIAPYPETRDYIQDIRERWSRLVGR